MTEAEDLKAAHNEAREAAKNAPGILKKVFTKKRIAVAGGVAALGAAAGVGYNAMDKQRAKEMSTAGLYGAGGALGAFLAYKGGKKLKTSLFTKAKNPVEKPEDLAKVQEVEDGFASFPSNPLLG